MRKWGKGVFDPPAPPPIKAVIKRDAPVSGRLAAKELIDALRDAADAIESNQPAEQLALRLANVRGHINFARPNWRLSGAKMNARALKVMDRLENKYANRGARSPEKPAIRIRGTPPW